MGFDLYAIRPKDPKQSHWYTGCFSWGWMLDQGVGLPIGYKGNLPPDGRYTYAPQVKKGHSIGPNSNDGYRVTATEAKGMAQAANAVVSWWEFYKEEYDKLSESDRKIIENDNFLTPTRAWPLNKYPPMVRPDFIEKTRSFAKFAQQSGGFAIR